MNNNYKSLYFIPWIGSKRLLRKYICPLIPNDLISYIEPFGGSGAILFARDKWCGCEVYNDLDGDLVNLFRIVKYHKEAFINELSLMHASRELFMQVFKNPGYTDLQRACRFIYLLNRSFGCDSQTFGVNKQNIGANSTINFIEKIPLISKRLDTVFIENKDYKTIITDYDREKAFFYCDPPYTSGHGYKTASTAKFEHEQLADTLKNIKGRFCLSYNDSDKVRSLYKGFNFVELVRKSNPNGYNRVHKSFKELAITNYDVVFDPVKNVYAAADILKS